MILVNEFALLGKYINNYVIVFLNNINKYINKNYPQYVEQSTMGFLDGALLMGRLSVWNLVGIKNIAMSRVDVAQTRCDL